MRNGVALCMALCMALIFTGCGPGSPSMPVRAGAAALHLKPPREGFDRLVICRPWKFVSGGVYSAFLIDGMPAANFKSGRAYFDVAPGKHRITVKITDYDRTDWGKGCVVDTRGRGETILRFDAGHAALNVEASGFSLEGLTVYASENPMVQTLHETEADQSVAIQEKARVAKEAEEISVYKKRIKAYMEIEDYVGLKVYVNEHPQASYYIPDYRVRLLFIGPENFQVGDLINYKKRAVSDVLLVAKIKSAKTPYKQFTMDEIVMLQEYDIDDTLIAAMIEVTTEIEKEMARDEKQQAFLTAQRDFAQTEAQGGVVGTHTTVTGDIGRQLGREVGNQLIKGLLNSVF